MARKKENRLDIVELKLKPDKQSLYKDAVIIGREDALNLIDAFAKANKEGLFAINLNTKCNVMHIQELSETMTDEDNLKTIVENCILSNSLGVIMCHNNAPDYRDAINFTDCSFCDEVKKSLEMFNLKLLEYIVTDEYSEEAYSVLSECSFVKTNCNLDEEIEI